MREWIGWRVDDVNGSSIGRLNDVIADDNGRPLWLAINELRFGEGRRFIAPAGEASGSSGRVWLPIERHVVRGSADLGNPLRSPQADRRLRSYYSVSGRRAA